MPAIKALAQGGTAVGAGGSRDPRFADKFASNLSQSTKISLTRVKTSFNLSSQDAIVALSGQLKTCSCDCEDLKRSSLLDEFRAASY
ncbi:lyase family protein [Vibrio lentus]|nr:lyase family protein [Vibrio lentus]